MTKTLPYFVLAFYKYTHLADPREEVVAHKSFLAEKEIACRIYLSEEGINGQLSGTKEAALGYVSWLRSHPKFQDISVKIHYWHEQCFPRQTVKYRKHLLGYDRSVNFLRQGIHVSPRKWKEMMESDEDYLLLDVRNDYEWKLGHFEGAVLPPCRSFREFDAYAETLKNGKDPKNTPVMMCCTGGIRCELYSSVLLEKGFEKVYQLDGGIINYGLQEGAKHWLGKLFVFDDRLAIPISDGEEAPSIGKCHCCSASTEAYYNCANMDCNTLFLSCPTCLEELSGCCQVTCQSTKRVRPYHHQNPHKPFRRKHLLGR